MTKGRASFFILGRAMNKTSFKMSKIKLKVLLLVLLFFVGVGLLYRGRVAHWPVEVRLSVSGRIFFVRCGVNSNGGLEPHGNGK